MTKKRLFLIAAVVLIVLALKKAAEQDPSEWKGLSETEARSKLATKLPARMPDEVRTEITDKIVGKMREKGVITEDDVEVDLRDGADAPAEVP
jgi:hypothetical protein